MWQWVAGLEGLHLTNFLMLFINNPFKRYMGALRWGFLLGINTRIAQDQCGKLWRLILEDILWIFQILEDGTSIFIIILIHFKVSGRDYIKGINIGAEVWFYYFLFSQTQMYLLSEKIDICICHKNINKKKKTKFSSSIHMHGLYYAEETIWIRLDRIWESIFFLFPHTLVVFFW